jgi:hypothetical protein
LELPVQQFHAVEAPLARQVDALLDIAVVAILELPEGISADADAVADRVRRFRLLGRACFLNERRASHCGCRRQERSPGIEHEIVLPK